MVTFGTCDPKDEADLYLQQRSYYSYQKGLKYEFYGIQHCQFLML